MTEDQINLFRNNAGSAIAKKNKTPIFIGIEHILHWPQGAHHCIVIEPSTEKSAFFFKEHSIEKIPDNIFLVTGELGENPVEPNQIIETAYIIFKLLNLADNLFQSNEIYPVSQNPFLENLVKNIQLLLAAKQFHASHIDTYAEISSMAKKNTWGAICNTEYVYQFLQRSIRYQTNSCIPFYLPPVSAQDTSSQIYIQVCNQLLQWLKLESPKVLTWSNNTVFNSVGNIIFLWEMLRRIGIPTRPVFTDYFFQQSLHLEGGIYFHLQQELLPKKENILLSIYPYDATIDSPKKSTVQLTPFLFTNETITRQKPPVLAENLHRDIAIIHHSRLNTIKQTEINELYELSCLVPDKQVPFASFSLLTYFFSEGVTNTHPFNTYAAKHLIRFLFYNFYSQIKIRQLQTLIPQLSEKWKINLYGENWDELFGKQFTITKSLSPLDLQNIYQTSLITLDVTPLYTLNPPNLNCSDCIHSGGIPLLMSPLFADFMKPVDIPVFETVQDIDHHITQFRDLEQRSCLILKLQDQMDTWNQDMKLTNGQSIEVLNIHEYPQIKLSDFVKTAATGYFLFLMGFFNRAFDKWCEALSVEIHIPLVLRLVSVGVGINELSKTMFCLKKALVKYPNHRELNECYRKLLVKLPQ